MCWTQFFLEVAPSFQACQDDPVVVVVTMRHGLLQMDSSGIGHRV
jgi:hypothetical protein